MEPVVFASRFTASFTNGRFKTPCRFRNRFCVVLAVKANPITQFQPSQNMDDIDAKLSVPFSFFVLISTGDYDE